MTRRLLLSTSLLALVAVTGCSSSSTTGATAQDSGTTTETDSSAVGQDSGSTGGDSGTTTGNDGSTALACAPATDAGTYASVTYAPATKGTNQCAASDITAFVTACGNAQTNTSCQDWFAANVAGGEADGGGAGNTCGNCIANPNNTGAIWFDPFGVPSWNYAGCIQLTDTTNGTACAAAFNNVDGCQSQYCDQCPDDNTYGQCANATIASGGQCVSYNSTFNTACANDLGINDGGTAAAACFPSMGAMNSDPDITYIATLICGSGQ